MSEKKMSNTRCGIFVTCCRCHRERPINELIRENEVSDDEDDTFPVNYYCYEAATEKVGGSLSACSMIARAERDEHQRKEEFG